MNANGGYYILEQGKATNIATYLSDSWKINNWLFDASARLEHIDMAQQTTNQSPVQMGSQFDLWDNAVDLPNGTYSRAGKTNTIPTFSVGANYEFTDHMSAYVRVNNGVHFANFDDVRCNTNGPLARLWIELHDEPAPPNHAELRRRIQDSESIYVYRRIDL